MSDDDAAQRAWELEMEMAIEGRGRTRSRSILATHDDDDDDNDANASADYTRHHRRHHAHDDDDNADDYDALEPPLPERAKSGSTERPPVDIVDGGHDPNWLNSPAGDGGGRSRARSFTAKRTMEMEQDAQASAGASSRRRSRSFSSLNARANADTNGDDADGNDTEQIVRRATSLSKIYLVGSAPVDVSKLQDESKIVGGKKVEVVEPTGALSSKALDALSEGLQSLSVDKSVLAVGGVAMIPTGSKSGSSLVSEAELEEKRMAEEEDQKLKNQKMSTRKTLSEKASLFKSKVFKTSTTKTSSPPATATSATANTKATATATTSTAAVARATPAVATATATAADATGAPAQPVVIKRHKLKLLLLGDSGVGKTSLMRVFSGDEFSESMLATAGVDFKLRHIAVGEDEIALQIWDTAGQERFHRITATYYKGANGIVLVYDVTDRKTFDNVGYWMNNIRQYASPNMPAMLLVGNKIDLPNRVVSSEEGLATAKQYNVRYIETSAKTSENTNGALETIARDAFFMSVNPTMTQKALMEKEKSLLGRRNKENCVIS